MALTRPKYSQIYDTDWKQSVEIASTVDVGNLILGNTQPNSVDGVTVLTNWRVLVKDQTNGAQNGIYLVRSAGTGSNGWWTRSLDAAQSNFVTAGLTVAVISGSVNGGKEFRLTTPDPITLGTTDLTFVDPNAAAGAGGANTEVQFNDTSTLSGSPGFTFNKFSNAVSISGSISTANISVNGNVSATRFFGDGSQLTGIDATSIQNSGTIVRTYSNGNVTVTGNLVPSANLVYDLGSPTQKWRSAYFGGNTVYVGSESISVASNGTWTFTSAGTNFNLGTNAVFNPPSANIAGNLNVGGAVTVSGNLSIEGNLFVNGNVTTINANNLNISDSLIYLADDNPADTIDIGFVSSFTPGGGSYQHTGFVRDASDGVWKLFAGVASEPTTTVDFTNASYSTIRVGNIYAGGTTANDNRFLQSTAGGLAWTAATSISSGVTSATADATSILVIANGVNSARFYGDIVYVYRDLELSANILVNGVGDFLGNVSAPYFVGDGSQLTGLPEGYSNVNASTFLASGTLTTAINITGNILGTAGTLNSLTVNGNITVGNIFPTANNVSNIGSATSKFRIIHAQATQAQYADLAEIYTSDQQYPAGTVVIFGGSAEVMQSHSSHDPRIAGVVSTNPAYLMNSTETGVPVALQGRVPCRVLGPVSQGDRVVSSHIAGVAQALDPVQYQPGCIIGKALQAIDNTEISTIEVVVGRV